MKRTYLATIVAVTSTLIFAGAVLAGGHKYQKSIDMPDDSGSAAVEEAVTSMSDCMTFSASHKSKGHEADKEEFVRQFGQPTGGKGSIHEYNYDKYTKVLLDCSARKCSCRCLAKQQ